MNRSAWKSLYAGHCLLVGMLLGGQDDDDWWPFEEALVWASSAGDLNGDGVADHVVCASQRESGQAATHFRGAVAVIDGFSGTLLSEESTRLSAQLLQPGLLPGVGCGELRPDPERPQQSIFVVHVKAARPGQATRFENLLAVFELPSLALRGWIACGTGGGEWKSGRLFTGTESVGLPPDRVILLSREVVVVSLSRLAVVWRAELPLDDAEHPSILDADGDGVADVIRKMPHDKLLVRSGATCRELAYGTSKSLLGWNTMIPLSVWGPNAWVSCTVPDSQSAPQLLLEFAGPDGPMAPKLEVPLRSL